MARLEAFASDIDAYDQLLSETDRLLEKEIRDKHYPMAFELEWLDLKDRNTHNSVHLSDFGFASSGGLSSYELYTLMSMAGSIAKFQFGFLDPQELLDKSRELNLSLYHEKVASLDDMVS